MYKLIVLDDDLIIRKGLAELIHWNDMGFELVQDFADGIEAIPYLESHPVDVILTDIEMAEVSGIDLAEFVFQKQLPAKVVFLSGFKEFEYAKSALKYNVVDYLLKPTQYNDIVRLFGKLKENLDMERKAMDDMEVEARRYNDLLPVIQEQFFTDVLMGALKNEKAMADRLKILQLSTELLNKSVYIIDIDFPPSTLAARSDYEFKVSIGKVVKRLMEHRIKSLSCYPVYHVFGRMKLVCLSLSDNRDDSKNQITEYLFELMKAVKKTFGVELKTSLESDHDSLIAYSQVNRPMEIVQDQISGKRRIAPDHYDKLIHKYKLFVSNAVAGNTEEVDNIVEHLLDEFQELPLSFTQRLVKDLLAIVAGTFTDGNANVSVAAHKYTDLVNAQSNDEIRDWSKNAIKGVLTEMEEQRDESAKRLMKLAINYISLHYHEGISLENVADHIFLNPVYFSRFFKLHAGVNFSEHLTQVRIQKAMELLGENKYKVHEISEKVGYSNSKYFSKVFKQQLGITPKEYVLNLVSQRMAGGSAE